MMSLNNIFTQLFFNFIPGTEHFKQVVVRVLFQEDSGSALSPSACRSHLLDDVVFFEVKCHLIKTESVLLACRTCVSRCCRGSSLTGRGLPLPTSASRVSR